MRLLLGTIAFFTGHHTMAYCLLVWKVVMP